MAQYERQSCSALSPCRGWAAGRGAVRGAQARAMPATATPPCLRRRTARQPTAAAAAAHSVRRDGARALTSTLGLGAFGCKGGPSLHVRKIFEGCSHLGSALVIAMRCAVELCAAEHIAVQSMLESVCVRGWVGVCCACGASFPGSAVLCVIKMVLCPVFAQGATAWTLERYWVAWSYERKACRNSARRVRYDGKHEDAGLHTLDTLYACHIHSESRISINYGLTMLAQENLQGM